MVMKHFQDQEWSEFVNHSASDDRQKAREIHLGTGSKRRLKTVAPWQKVANAAAVAESVLLFDSFSQPPLAGTRSSAMRVRQMLYRAEPYQIDIQIEAQPERDHLVVTGQLLDVNHPEMVGGEVQVTLSDGRGDIVNTVTNQLGEFSGEVNNSGDLELSFLGRSGKPIVILLRGALGPSSKAKK
jgi:hypothetical protein